MSKKYVFIILSILFIFLFIIALAGCIAPTGLSVSVTDISGSPLDIDVAPTLNPISNLTATIYAFANISSVASSLIGSASPWTLTSYTVSYTVVSSNIQTPAGFSIDSYTSVTSARITTGNTEVIFRPMDNVIRDWFVTTVYPTYGIMTLKATVTFYGKTDSGQDVSVSGQFDINTFDVDYSSS